MERNEFEQRDHRAELLWAVKAGITDGTSPECFVSREEAVHMLYRALEYFFGQIIELLTTQTDHT